MKVLKTGCTYKTSSPDSISTHLDARGYRECTALHVAFTEEESRKPRPYNYMIGAWLARLGVASGSVLQWQKALNCYLRYDSM